MSYASADGRPALVAVDWGTTSCRFVLVAADGSTLDRRSGPGIVPLAAAVTDEQPDRSTAFGRALQESIGDWLEEHPGVPLVMCGMVGADRGWRDAGYRGAPAPVPPHPDELVPVTVPGHPAYLVPGVMQRDPVPDVMRGEETQVLGALLEHPSARTEEALVVAPGTHSKWVRVAGGRIQHFRTYMTGDLFAALSEHTILAAGAAGAAEGARDARPGGVDGTDGVAEVDGSAAEQVRGGPRAADAFARGLDLAFGDERASLSRYLFRARSGLVLGDLAASDLHEFLSGLVIGDEVADALTLLAPGAGTSLLLIASDQLADRYRRALDRAGVPVHFVEGDPATRGLHAIACQLGDSAAASDPAADPAAASNPAEEHPSP